MLAASPAAAQVNPGFENGLTGWTTNYAAGVGTSSSLGGFTPVTGTSFGYAYGGAGTNVATTLSQSFTLGAGDTLSGSVGFIGFDGGFFNDDAYLSVNGTNLFFTDNNTLGYGVSTGWTPFSFVAPTSGAYLLQLGSRNVVDNTVNSLAVLDNIQIAAAPALPEPATWAMLILGIGAAGASLRRRERAALATA